LFRKELLERSIRKMELFGGVAVGQRNFDLSKLFAASNQWVSVWEGLLECGLSFFQGSFTFWLAFVSRGRLNLYTWGAFYKLPIGKSRICSRCGRQQTECHQKEGTDFI
jgi:hypothetical protein